MKAVWRMRCARPARHRRLSISDPCRVSFSTFLGGNEGESGEAVAFGPDGAARVGGATLSPDFPVTPDAYDTRFISKTGFAGFVTRFDSR